MITRASSRARRPCPFGGQRDALLPLGEPLLALRAHSVRRFGAVLSPVHYRRGAPRGVSYYALLKWWLLLSQHPPCRRGPTSFRTQHGWGTLAGGLGCSPLDDGAYPPPSSCPGLVHGHSEFGSGG